MDKKSPFQQVFISMPINLIKEEGLNLWQTGYHTQHRSRNAQGWHSLTLYGEGPYITLGGDYGDSSKYHWTDIGKRMCPATVEWLQSLPYKELYRARFMFLEPGGYIKIHHDKEPEEAIGEVVVDDAMNISVTQPNNCYLRQVFKDGDSDVPFKEGSAFFFNNRYFHYAENRSSEIRIHLILHAKWLFLSLRKCKLKFIKQNYLNHGNELYENKERLNDVIENYSPDLSSYY